MTGYISFGTALEMFAVAYLVSGILLIAVSYIGWVMVEIMEESGQI